MSIWDILEIEATSDNKIIKRAYAKKLKVTRPDEDPKGFQELHWAYKTALQDAEWMTRQETKGHDKEDHVDESPEEYNSNSPLSEPNISNLDLQLPNNAANNSQPEEKPISTSIAQLRNQLPSSQEPSSDSVITDNNYSTDNQTNQTISQTVDQAIEPADDSVEQHNTAEVVTNPYQIEGERLLEITQLLLDSNGDQAKANSWTFILESSFILEDHFNWRLGLEILRLIREHNLESVNQVHKIVGQEALTYLDSIFNWKDNYHQVIQVMGDEYKTWLDMIREPESQDTNWQDKIRGGKKIELVSQTIHTTNEQSPTSMIAPPFKRFMAWLIDWVFLILVLILLKQDSPNMSPLIPLIVFPLLYFVFFESSQLQGSIGKRLLSLKVVKSNFEQLGVIDCILRTICFLVYQALIVLAVVVISKGIPLAAFIIAGAYAYSFSKDPTIFYDRITNTRVVQTR